MPGTCARRRRAAPGSPDPQFLRRRGRALRADALDAGRLQGDAGEVLGAEAEVAAPEAAGLVGEAEEPLEAVALHRRGGLRDEAGVEVEGGADGDERHAEALAVLVEEDLLARAAEADEDEPRAGAADLG